jgi:probable rRNA maturation factor
MTRPPALDIDVIVDCDRWPTDAEAIVRRALAQAALAVQPGFEGRVVAVLLTDDAAVRGLNALWRGIDKPTNVLSFPAPAGSPSPGHASTPLGDIAIACETTAREAEAEGKPLGDHLAHLAVHGFLHLLGYDHEQDAQAEAMEQVERDVLRRLGVPDPYLTEHPRESVRI